MTLQGFIYLTILLCTLKKCSNLREPVVTNKNIVMRICRMQVIRKNPWRCWPLLCTHIIPCWIDIFSPTCNPAGQALCTPTSNFGGETVWVDPPQTLLDNQWIHLPQTLWRDSKSPNFGWKPMSIPASNPLESQWVHLSQMLLARQLGHRLKPCWRASD